MCESLRGQRHSIIWISSVWAITLLTLVIRTAAVENSTNATSVDKPGPYDMETESKKMAFAAQHAKKQNALYHPVYTEALKNISDAHKLKGYTTPQATDEVSVHERDAFLTGAPERMGIDGGRARPKGQFKEMWRKREDLIAILTAIRRSDKKMQVHKHRLYVDTQKKLQDLETELGMPYDKAADAIGRMKVAMDDTHSKAVVEQYKDAMKDLKVALDEGPPVPHGLYKQYIQNAGPSQEQKEDQLVIEQRENYTRTRDNIAAKHQQQDFDAAQARFKYAEGGPRPGCANIDGPCGHNDKEVPGAPSQVTAHYLTAYTVTLSWQVPRINRAFITGYRIMMKNESDAQGEWMEVARADEGVQQLNKKVRNLNPFTNYLTKVEATYAPASVRNMSINELTKILTLHGVESYTAAVQDDKNTLVSRVNKVLGEPSGPPSATIEIRTLRAVPSAPQDVVIISTDYNPGDATTLYTISWKASKPEGSPISGYQVLKRRGGDQWAWEEVTANTGTTATRGTFAGFHAGAYSYTVKVAAVNGMGRSKFSEPSTSVTSPIKRVPFSVPAPTYNSAYCKGVDCGLRLLWKSPPSGGSMVTAYRIYYQYKMTGPWIVAIDNTESSETEADIRKLEGGTNYNFRLQAWNAQGWSNVNSPYTTIMTPSGVPGAPGKPVYGNITGTTLVLTWGKPMENGSPITGYRITYQEGGAGGFFQKVNNTKSNKLKTTVKGLSQGGVQYEFKVSAYNKMGIGPDSEKSEPCQTQYDSIVATKMATATAHKNFQVQNKLYTLRQLNEQQKLYKARYEDTLKRYRVAKERGQKAETQVGQLQSTSQIDEQLSGQRLSLERDLAIKKIQVTDDIDSKTRQLDKRLFQKSLDHANQLSAERMDEQKKYFEKIINKKDEQESKLKDNIYLLNKQVQKEQQLRQAVEERARSASAPQKRDLKESQNAAHEKAQDSARNKLEALFNLAVNNGVKNAQLKASLQNGVIPHISVSKPHTATVKVQAEKANVLNSAFLLNTKDVGVQELGAQEVGEQNENEETAILVW